MAIDRRDVLRGSLAAAAFGTTTIAAALAGDDELGRLIANYEHAYARLGAVFAETEDDDPERLEALCAEGRAMLDLMRYRPKDMAEVRRRSTFLLGCEEWREGVGEFHLVTILRSMADVA